MEGVSEALIILKKTFINFYILLMKMCDVILLSQCVQRDSGVWAAQKPARAVRMEVCAINTTGRVSVLQGSWVKSARTVSMSGVHFHSEEK